MQAHYQLVPHASISKAKPHEPNESLDQNPRIQRVLATVDCIPRGSVATYGQVAAEAGLPGRARWVGRILGQLPKDTALPWHRVVSAPGRITLRPQTSQQIRILRSEGVEVTSRGRVSLKQFGWLR